tara:strand:- start:54 stop:383 length:330 start_codon:yes stop_codon:yes gene_type:complete
MSTYELVKNDTGAQIKATLTHQNTGVVANFSGGSARLKFRKRGATAILFTLLAVDELESFAKGIALFKFGAGNLDLTTGYYEGEIEVTYLGGTVDTVFEVLSFYVRAEF